MTAKAKHGGKRIGAGRPKGAANRRSEALAERLRELGVEPAERLAKLGVAAEKDGDKALAAKCFEGLLPYLWPRLKHVENANGENSLERLVLVATNVPRGPNDPPADIPAAPVPPPLARAEAPTPAAQAPDAPRVPAAAAPRLAAPLPRGPAGYPVDSDTRRRRETEFDPFADL